MCLSFVGHEECYTISCCESNPGDCFQSRIAYCQHPQVFLLLFSCVVLGGVYTTWVIMFIRANRVGGEERKKKEEEKKKERKENETTKAYFYLFFSLAKKGSVYLKGKQWQGSNIDNPETRDFMNKQANHTIFPTLKYHKIWSTIQGIKHRGPWVLQERSDKKGTFYHVL